jgi:hypothetical protein
MGGRVISSDAAFVVAEHHIHDPMQAIFNRPVISDHRAAMRRRGPTSWIIV